MTLKLVSKSLPNKYAEQLYKNELNYSSDMNKLNERIELDYLRNSHYIDLRLEMKKSKAFFDFY